VTEEIEVVVGDVETQVKAFRAKEILHYEPAFLLVNSGCQAIEEMIREYSDIEKLTQSLTNPVAPP
jgi:hypothetical protein